MKQVYAFLLCTCCLHLVNSAQIAGHVNDLVNSEFSLQQNVAKLQPLEFTGKASPATNALNRQLSGKLKEYAVFDLANNYSKLQKQVPFMPVINLSIPTTPAKTTTLKLVRNQIVTPGFFVQTSDGKIITNPAGTNDHFLGVAETTGNSLAAVSFNPSGITGFFSTASGNTIIETTGQKGLQIIYNDKDVLAKPVTGCTVNEAGAMNNIFKNTGASVSKSALSCKTVKMYIECTYAMYQAHHSDVDSVISFVFTLFNASSAIFKNDGINIQISEIFIWSQPDIYANANVATMSYNLNERLRIAYNNGHKINADIAHVITPVNLSGGAANRIASDDCGKITGDYACAASSSIRPFAAMPAFSFAVFTFAHETGHTLGSPHTQSCLWPGGPIDDCVAPEGNCTPGNSPVTGGTIMSYCYASTYGVNFLNGFGPLPATLIKEQIEASACLSSCADTVCSTAKINGFTTLINNSVIKFKWVKEAPKYRIGLKPNTTQQWQYYEVMDTDSFLLAKTSCEEFYEFSIAAFCTSLNKYGIVYASFIGNPGATKLKITEDFPGSPVSICSGDSYILSVRPDSNFIYKWYLDGTLQAQFVTDSIQTTRAGKYAVTANYNGCIYYSDTFNLLHRAQNPSIIFRINNLKVDFNPNVSCSKNYLWDFGDGTQSVLSNPTHTYLSRKKYTVNLKVWDGGNNIETSTKELLLFDEYIDSLNHFSKFGRPEKMNFTAFKCSDAATFRRDSFNLNILATSIPVPRLLYTPLGTSSIAGFPKNGTLEFKLFPVQGLVKQRGYMQDTRISDTGYVLNVGPAVTVERNRFFFNFSKWGGVQVAVDSVVLGSIAKDSTGPLRLNEWNTIGISYGIQGIQVMVNGLLYASSTHSIDSAHAALLGIFNFGTYIGRIGNDPAVPLCFKGFEGALDIVRFSQTEKDYTFSAGKPWQGKDTVVLNKQICFNSSFEGYTTPGTYYKKNVTAGGCDSITTINLKINKDITLADSMLHPVDNFKGSILVKNIFGGAAPYKFSWSTGDTTQSLGNGLPGNYVLKIKDSIGCEKSFNYKLYQLNSGKDHIVLLGNPVKQSTRPLLRIGTTNSKDYNAVIYDVTGRKCYIQQIHATSGVSEQRLNIQLQKGAYLLHLISNKEKRVIKFMIY